MKPNERNRPAVDNRCGTVIISLEEKSKANPPPLKTTKTMGKSKSARPAPKSKKQTRSTAKNDKAEEANTSANGSEDDNLKPAAAKTHADDKDDKSDESSDCEQELVDLPPPKITKQNPLEAIDDESDEDEDNTWTDNMEDYESKIPATTSTMVFTKDKANFLGIFFPKMGVRVQVNQFANGVHYRCNEPNNAYAMYLLGTTSVKHKELCDDLDEEEKEAKTVIPTLRKVLDEEMIRLAACHDGCVVTKPPDRQCATMVNVIKAFVTDRNEGPNPMMSLFVCQFHKTRLGVRGHQVDGQSADQAVSAVRTVVNWLLNVAEGDTNRWSVWPFVCVHLVKDHMRGTLGHAGVDLCMRSEGQEDHKKREKEVSKVRKCKNANIRWCEEKRPEVREEMEEHVKWFEDNELNMFPDHTNRSLSKAFEKEAKTPLTPENKKKKRRASTKGGTPGTVKSFNYNVEGYSFKKQKLNMDALSEGDPKTATLKNPPPMGTPNQGPPAGGASNPEPRGEGVSKAD